MCQTLNFSPRAEEDSKQGQSGRRAAGQCRVQKFPVSCAQKGEDRPQQTRKKPAYQARGPEYREPAEKRFKVHWLLLAGSSM